MKFWAFLFMFSLPLLAAEVAVIDETKAGDLQLGFTEESLYTALDKSWMTHPCKTRFNFAGTLKETFTSKQCRAEVVKFLLNNGYKPLDTIGRTFSR